MRSFLTNILLVVFMCGSIVVPGDFILCFAEHGHVVIESAGTTHCMDRDDRHDGEIGHVWLSRHDHHTHLDIPLSVFSGAFLHSVPTHPDFTLCRPDVDDSWIMPHLGTPSFFEQAEACSTGPPHHEAPHLNSMLRSTVITV